MDARPFAFRAIEMIMAGPQRHRDGLGDPDIKPVFSKDDIERFCNSTDDEIVPEFVVMGIDDEDYSVTIAVTDGVYTVHDCFITDTSTRIEECVANTLRHIEIIQARWPGTPILLTPCANSGFFYKYLDRAVTSLTGVFMFQGDTQPVLNVTYHIKEVAVQGLKALIMDNKMTLAPRCPTEPLITQMENLMKTDRHFSTQGLITIYSCNLEQRDIDDDLLHAVLWALVGAWYVQVGEYPEVWVDPSV